MINPLSENVYDSLIYGHCDDLDPVDGFCHGKKSVISKARPPMGHSHRRRTCKETKAGHHQNAHTFDSVLPGSGFADDANWYLGGCPACIDFPLPELTCDTDYLVLGHKVGHAPATTAHCTRTSSADGYYEYQWNAVMGDVSGEVEISQGSVVVASSKLCLLSPNAVPKAFEPTSVLAMARNETRLAVMDHGGVAGTWATTLELLRYQAKALNGDLPALTSLEELTPASQTTNASSVTMPNGMKILPGGATANAFGNYLSVIVLTLMAFGYLPH